MGTTNPLRGHSSALCNMGVFYYVIKNLSNVLNCHANAHLLSLCYLHDLKVYGYEPILDKFVSEIKRLYSDGFTSVFPVIGKKTIYVKYRTCHIWQVRMTLLGCLNRRLSLTKFSVLFSNSLNYWL